MRAGCFVAVAGSLVVAAPPAVANCHEDPDVVGVSPGIVLASDASDASDRSGLILGGEVSAYRLRRHDEYCGDSFPTLQLPDFSWTGAYIDLVHDFTTSATRITIGPEVGRLSVFGLDGGAVLAVQAGHPNAGIAVRGIVTFGFVQAYVRYERLFDDRFGDNVVEVGALLKLPRAVKRIAGTGY
jgi:hypothetical protein